MPMELFNGLSSDQTAVIGCAAAILVCGTMMSLSYYVGRFLHGSQNAPGPNEPHTLKMPDPATLQAAQRQTVPVPAAKDNYRRAA